MVSLCLCIGSLCHLLKTGCGLIECEIVVASSPMAWPGHSAESTKVPCL